MSYVTAGQQGVDAFGKKDYEKATELLGQGLAGNPKQPKWLIARCEAYMKVKPAQPENALLHAERAYRAAYDRGDRKLMLRAMHFRATSLFRLGKFADSDRCCRWLLDLSCGHPATSRDDSEPPADVDAQGRYKVPAFDPTDEIPFKKDYSKEATRIAFFRGQVVPRIKALWEAGGDDPALKPTATKMPDVEFEECTREKPAEPRHDKAGHTDNVEDAAGDDGVPTAALKAAIEDRYRGDVNVWHRFYIETKQIKNLDPAVAQELEAKNKSYWDTKRPRCEHYQSGSKVTLSIYLKGVDKHCAGCEDPCKLCVQPQKLTLLNLPGYGAAGRALFLALPKNVQPFLTAWRISSVKIEIILTAACSEKWSTVPLADKCRSCPASEVSETEVGEYDAWIPTPEKAGPHVQLPKDKRLELSHLPAEHTSIEAASTTAPSQTATKSKAKPSTSTAGPSYPTSSKMGPKDWDKVALDDDDDGKLSSADDMFRELFKMATPEQRRAMEKSFVESSGTALSTDWAQVSKTTFETQPPDGTEAKKFDF